MMVRDPITIEVEIRIEKTHHGEVWSVEPKLKDENKKRVEKHKQELKDNWRNRHGKPFDLEDHSPIVFIEGDTLVFTCPAGLKFAIGAKKNPDVDEFPDTPDDPFDWNEFKIVEAGASKSESAVVTRTETLSGPGPKYQAFYKFHGWVLEGGVFKPVDPDGYCGS